MLTEIYRLTVRHRGRDVDALRRRQQEDDGIKRDKDRAAKKPIWILLWSSFRVANYDSLNDYLVCVTGQTPCGGTIEGQN